MGMSNIIMIPGLGSDGAVWQPTIDALGQDAACTIGDTLSDDSLQDMATRILDNAPDRFALAGVSMGGMVALEIMRKAPERVQRLALFDTNAAPDTPEQAAGRQRANAAINLGGDYAAMARASLHYLIHPDSSADVKTALVQMSLRVGPQAYIRQNIAVLNRSNLLPVLTRISIPTLVAVGEQDVLTPLACSTQIRDGINGAVLHIIADCGHLPPLERPDRVAELLRNWLE